MGGVGVDCRRGVLEPIGRIVIFLGYPPINDWGEPPIAIHLLNVDYSTLFATVRMDGACGDCWSRLVWQVFIGPGGLMHGGTSQLEMRDIYYP